MEEEIRELEKEFDALDKQTAKFVKTLAEDISDFDRRDSISLSSDLREIANRHKRIVQLFETQDNGQFDFITMLPKLHEIEENREEFSDDILGLVQELNGQLEEWSKNNPDEKDYSEITNRIIASEKKAREIESKIEESWLNEARERALDQAKRILDEERPTIIFEADALQRFCEFGYRESYAGESLEAAGLFSYEVVSNQGSPDNYRIKEFREINEYKSRSKTGAYVDNKEANINPYRFEANKKAFAHTHPPGGPKTHSSKGQDTTGNPAKGKFAVLGIVESKSKIWIVPQVNTSEGWINLPIKIKSGSIPQVHVKKYNKAIVKALAYSQLSKELQAEYGNWENRKEKMNSELTKILPWQGRGEEEWIKYLPEETY